MPHRLHHLDHTRHTGRRLRVPDVRLDRPQQQRGLPIAAIGRQQRLRLDRVTQCRAGAVALDDIDITRGQPRARQRLADHPLLRRAVGSRETVRRAVLVHRRTPQHRQDLVPVAAGVRQPLQHQHADALRPADAVGGLRVRLAGAVDGHAALPGEVDEGLRGGHDRHATGQRQSAVAGAQRLRRPVHRHQRRRARRVHRDGGTLEAQRVRHPAGGDAGRAAVAPVPLELGGVEQVRVVAVHDAREHAGAAAAQRGRVDPGPLHGLPGGFQQQALLRVRGQCLGRAHPEELRVELARPVQEVRVADVGGAQVVGVRVVEGFHVPAAVVRERGHGVDLVGDQPPQVLRGGHPARVAARHAHDHHRVVGQWRQRPHGCGVVRFGGADQLAEQVLGDRGRGRVVEHQGRGQPQPGRRGQAVAQFHRGQRVEAQFLERPRRVHRQAVRVAQHHRDPAAHQVEQHLGALDRRQRRQGAGQPARRLRRARRHPATPRPHQAAQHRGHVAARPQGRRVQQDRCDHGLVRHGHGRVEQAHALLQRQRRQAVAGDAGPVGVGEPGGHAGFGRPSAPGERQAGQPGRPPVGGEGVEEGVARRVVALARRTEGGRDRGEHHERVEVGGQLVQVPGGVDLHPQHGVDVLGGQRVDDTVGQHPGRVHHGPHRVLGGHRHQHRGERVPVGHVAGAHGRGRTHCGQVGHQFGDPFGLFAAAAEQQQVPRAALGGEVAGQGRAQPGGTAGDQDGGLRVPARGGRGRGEAGQPGGRGRAVAHAHLRFVGAQHDAQRQRPGIRVNQQEPAGVLRLGGPHQPPRTGRGQVRAHRAVHDEHQLCPGGRLGRQPLLEQAEDVVGEGVGVGDHVAVGRQRHHDGVGCPVDRGEVGRRRDRGATRAQPFRHTARVGSDDGGRDRRGGGAHRRRPVEPVERVDRGTGARHLVGGDLAEHQ
ncbi:hypothetical protein UO65_3864 [Actinokineospora spheciospongiae]|uniref:Uncharacterized protein n=1 Tax=Actinokineospora spheciospongiae TaxID=909613 RepID=W7IWL2_9PSEU|nr:hypothetical protein UO65_3864 [Actinokineospora spheciospongiae]